MHANLAFRNAAPRYPEKVSVYLPKGARAAIERAAEKTGVTAPELLRRVISEKLHAATNEESDGAKPFRAGPQKSINELCAGEK